MCWCAPSRRGESGVPRVWCALPRKVCMACLPQGRVYSVPLLEGRVWCALPRMPSSGIKVWCVFLSIYISLRAELYEVNLMVPLIKKFQQVEKKHLVCPLQEGRVWCALSSKCYSYCHHCYSFHQGSGPCEYIPNFLHLVSSTSYGEVAIG